MLCLAAYMFGYAEAIFPYKYPAQFSMIVAFVGIWLFSVTDKSKSASLERERFFSQFVRSQPDSIQRRGCSLTAKQQHKGSLRAALFYALANPAAIAKTHIQSGTGYDRHSAFR